MKFIVLSMDNEIGEMRRELINYEYEWFKAKEPTKDFVDRFYFRAKTKERKMKGIAGCFYNHTEIMKYIYENDLYDVIVCEDDSLLRNDIDLENIKGEDVCLLSAWLAHPTSWEKNRGGKYEGEFKVGINKMKYDEYRFVGTGAIYYPTPTKTKELYDSIMNSEKKFRPFDLFLSYNKMINYLYYPSPLICIDCIDKDRKLKKKKDSQISVNGNGAIIDYRISKKEEFDEIVKLLI